MKSFLTPSSASPGGRSPLSWLVTLALVAGGVYFRQHRRSEANDLKELNAAMKSGGLSAAEGVETQSELGGKMKAFARRSQELDAQYDAVSQKYPLDEMIAPKSLRSPESIRQALAGVAALDTAAVEHSARKLALVDEMLASFDERSTIEAKLAAARKKSGDLLQEERAVIAAARDYLAFAQKNPPKFDAKTGTVRWLPSAEGRAEALEAAVMDGALTFTEHVEAAETQRKAQIGAS